MRGLGSGVFGGEPGRVRLAVPAGLSVLGVLGLLVFAPAALALSPPHIYWANQGPGTIGVANLDGADVNQSFITGANGSGGLAVDGEHIYWASFVNGTIGRANLDGTGVNGSFITGANGPTDVAVDARHVYWVNLSGGTIGEANLDGTGVNQSFITGANSPADVALDGQHIYWTNFGSSTIGEANLDGTGVNQSFITGASMPDGLAVDGQHIYWANQGPGTIGVANLDGTDVNESFITGANQPGGLAVDGQHVYWTDVGTNTIGVANLDGTGVNESFITGANVPGGVAVSAPVARVSPAAPPAFATTPQGEVSHPETLTVTNSGQRDLSIGGVWFTGSDPGDFLITSDSCQGSVAPDESCQLTVRFSPLGAGARAATFQIATNDHANSPLAVPLRGTGARTLSSTSLSISRATITFGSEQTERFGVTVSAQIPGTPTGKATIRAGNVVLCTVRLASGKGTCSPQSKALPAGRRAITAAYAGNTNFSPSTSQAKTLTVKP